MRDIIMAKEEEDAKEVQAAENIGKALRGEVEAHVIEEIIMIIIVEAADADTQGIDMTEDPDKEMKRILTTV